MTNPEQLEEQREGTCLIAEKLLEDGSNPDALYTIEYRLFVDDLETLEKATVRTLRPGYEATDPGELEIEDGGIMVCCDIPSECASNAGLVDAQVRQLMALVEKLDVEHNGWGTHSEGPNGEDGDDEDLVDEDDNGIRH